VTPTSSGLLQVFGLYVSIILQKYQQYLNYSAQIAELFNFHAHYTLRNLRPPGTKVRAIPRGFGFDLISCPNYFWEIISWTAIAGMTNNIFGESSLFTLTY